LGNSALNPAAAADTAAVFRTCLREIFPGSRTFIVFLLPVAF
jgi:hypothetical protein